MEQTRVIYLDSWVWLEYGLDGTLSDIAEEMIHDARDTGGIVSSITLTEVDYILNREVGSETADLVTSAIEDFEQIHVVPVTSEIALYASRLRTKYYQRRERELSYADAIHLATAVLTDCETLHTGDSDFEDLDELETVVHRPSN
ncbi:PIN domain-containing protein [Haladaptatus sp. W1]|uniref:PIN domain-containing protein n=1 Tax=Haladaptatus sp. W1 TaxID=1897478 RepID=UPI0020C8027D|nr:PIN domain-containing protein [Haladaptatus sp. W1]